MFPKPHIKKATPGGGLREFQRRLDACPLTPEVDRDLPALPALQRLLRSPAIRIARTGFWESLDIRSPPFQLLKTLTMWGSLAVLPSTNRKFVLTRHRRRQQASVLATLITGKKSTATKRPAPAMTGRAFCWFLAAPRITAASISLSCSAGSRSGRRQRSDRPASRYRPERQIHPRRSCAGYGA